MRVSYSYVRRRPVEHYRRPWFTRPAVYLPLGFVVASIVGFALYCFYVATSISAEANTFDLSKLEQMESASVIVDRNDKIFGQIYVENRETIPYDQIPRDLINAVVAIE